MVIIPSKMGRHNKRALLDRLLRLGTASRADLAKSLGLSQPTAGKIADELLELGVFEETDELVPNGSAHTEKGPRMGRPGRMLRLTQSKSRFLGIKLGLTETYLSPLPLSVTDEDHWLIRIKTPATAKEWSRKLRQPKCRKNHSGEFSSAFPAWWTNAKAEFSIHPIFVGLPELRFPAPSGKSGALPSF